MEAQLSVKAALPLAERRDDFIGDGSGPCFINTLRLRQNGRHFADDIFK